MQDAFLVEKSSSLVQRIHSVHNDSFLVASFGKSQGSTNQALNTSSAVCMYSLAEIDRRFDENIHNCFNGSMRYRNMEYISGTILEGKCPDKLGASGNILNFCEIGLYLKVILVWCIATKKNSYKFSTPPRNIQIISVETELSFIMLK